MDNLEKGCIISTNILNPSYMDQPIDKKSKKRKKGKKRILRFSKSGIPLHMLDDIQIQELDPDELTEIREEESNF
tara:strand:+ start:473 stop:697 length:225 start_codon:yes stop_codon:yes gene_type:complete